jgi:hypothetical protein
MFSFSELLKPFWVITSQALFIQALGMHSWNEHGNSNECELSKNNYYLSVILAIEPLTSFPFAIESSYLHSETMLTFLRHYCCREMCQELMFILSSISELMKW